jgi:SAM-dependent methyltransferase
LSYYCNAVAADYANYVQAAEDKREHFRQKFRELEGHLPSPGPMLDVGCAAGFLLEVAFERGWDPWGVELSPAFAAYTTSALYGRIRYGRLRDGPPEGSPRTVSLITLFDVLEHTPTSRQDLERCRDLLTAEGVILVQLPCIDAMARKLLGRHWYHYAPPAHLNFFSGDTFGRLAQSLGLTVVYEAWTRKLMSIDYLACQVANTLELPYLSPPPVLGRRRLRIPMSERLFVLRRSRHA